MHARGILLDQFTNRYNKDILSQWTKLKLDLDLERNIRADGDRLGEHLESGKFRADGIGAKRDVVKNKAAIRRRERAPVVAGDRVVQRHSNAFENPARFVMENSAYRSDVYLRGAHANKDRPSDDQIYQRPMSSYTHQPTAVLERRSLDRAPTGEILQRLNPYTKSYSLKPALGRPHVVAPPGQ